MGGYFSERLSACDNLFLVAETDGTPMHIAAVQVIEAASLRRHDGGIDSERVTRALESVLHLIPRNRQKLRFPRLGGRPVWVDDPHFDLAYHVRHVRLPQPCAPEQLKCEVARILELPLDRGRPLWELWVVEGLAADEQHGALRAPQQDERPSDAGSDTTSVSWAQATAQNVSFHYVPVDVAEQLGNLIDAHATAWICTSATLAVGDSFEHFMPGSA